MIMDGISFYPNFNLNTYAPASAGVTDVAKEGNIQGDPRAVENSGKTEGARECQTCKNRKYQDGSDEMVSFKSASHISPEAAATRVMAHEMEHVSNAYAKAETGEGKVLQASVTLKTSVCPECGRVYVSGGVTNTKIKYSNEDQPYQKQLKAILEDAVKGNSIDIKK
ncbi:MAG: hypothetical protein J5515_09015 [Lachnospiraceae bacterium]|nr:hypothetical protein [Lachnospiraceae bacterium]